MNIKDANIAIVHDWFLRNSYGGAEKVTFLINNFLIKNLAYFDENIIKFNYQNLVNADKIVIEKIIKKNYSFFFKNLKQIRSKKVEILVEKLLKKNFNKFNLGGMIVKKENKLLIFSAKSL